MPTCRVHAPPSRYLTWPFPGLSTPAATAEGKLYLCAVKDCYSNRIVGYSIDSRMESSLAVAAIRNAIGLRSPLGTILHSDSETVVAGVPGVLTLTAMGTTGCWCRALPGFPDPAA